MNGPANRVWVTPLSVETAMERLRGIRLSELASLRYEQGQVVIGLKRGLSLTVATDDAAPLILAIIAGPVIAL